MTSDIKHPLVLWAQRSSTTAKQKNFIYLTVKLAGIIRSTLNYTITDTTINLKVNAKEGNEECKYAFELDFYAQVIPEMLEKSITKHSVTFVIFKKDMASRYWPQLSKTTPSHVETDFSRWTWEGDEYEDPEKDESTVGDEDIDSSSTGSTNEGPSEQSNAVLDDTKGPVIPQVLWAQRNSSTDTTKNVVSLCFMIQDIAESTLKYTVTQAHISFYAYAREGYEEREYALELDFYADVMPDEADKQLTKDFFMIVLQKKQSRSQHWPRLQRLPGILSYIGTDFSRWAWEGDQSDNITCGTTNTKSSYSSRFQHTGDLKHIECAIFHYQKAVDSTPSGHADLPHYFNNLGNMYFCRFEHTGNLEDIECAIFHHQTAVDSTPSGHADLPQYYNNLGNSCLHRCEHTGNLEDIECAIFNYQKAVDSTPSGHVDLPGYVNNLGSSYLCRFKHTRNLEDIECAISHHQKAVDSAPSGNVDLPGCVNNLGNSYICRFKHTGNLEDVECAIAHHHKSVESTPSDHADLPSRFSNLGNSYLFRFKHTGHLEDIDCAIFHNQKAVNSTPSGHVGLSHYVDSLGHSYLGRFKHTGNLKDVECAIFNHQKAVDSTPSGHVNLPGYFDNLGNSYFCRFKHTGNLEDIQCAIAHLHKSVESTPSGHADLPGRFSNLGSSYSSRFKHSGNLEDIECAIFHHQRAVDSTPSGHVGLPDYVNSLGSSYLGRFEYTGNLEDIECAIFNHQRAVDSTPSGHVGLPGYVNSLGNSYLGRFEYTGNLEDIECAIFNHQKAVDSTPSSHVDLPGYVNNLGNSYLCRFKHTGNLEDIQCAIAHHHKSVDSTPSGHADMPDRFSNLGRSYSSRFEHTGNLEDIECAIFHHQRAVDSTPSGHVGLPDYVNSLGNSYFCRFEHTGNLEDIECAIFHHRKAVDSTPSSHVGLLRYVDSLGNSYLGRFEHTGNLKDVECAIFNHQKAVDSTPSGHVNLPRCVNNLGISYFRRFKHTGNLEDIECAIFHSQKAVDSTPDGHADRRKFFSNLGISYSCRFEHTGNLEDIECAIFHSQKAVDSTPYGHADRRIFFGTLGSSYTGRFKHTGNLEDIECAISHHQKAIDSTPSGHATLPGQFSNLGNSYLQLFKRTGNLEDIECAISHHQKAVNSTAFGHTDLPDLFNNLGYSYLSRFQHTADFKDIDCAISHLQKAVESSPPGHATLSGQFSNLGNAYMRRFQHSHSFSDAQNSIESFHRSAKANGAPSVRFKSAKTAAEFSFLQGHPHYLTDFSLAINLLSEIAGFEQTILRRHANLHGHSGFVELGVAASLSQSRPAIALEWLEQGRCLVWNQLTQLRTPVDDLRLLHPSLAKQFINVARELESYGTRSSLSATSTKTPLASEISLQNEVLKHTTSAAEYKRLLNEIRILPGFHDFLQPPTSTSLLSSLPPDGPVVIFNLHETRCDALALRSGYEEPLHIPLEKFSLDQAENLQKVLHMDILKLRVVTDLERASRRLPDTGWDFPLILKTLWFKVVRPILTALGYSAVPIPLSRSRIWWCPTGPLAFLPLHAAGIYDGAHVLGTRVSDFVVSSYTPTVRSINEKFATPSSVRSSNKLLLISQPNTPGLPPISSTTTEIRALSSLVKDTPVNSFILEGDAATTEEVKREIQSCNWVHFACHGVQDANEPLESGLCLHDGRLTLLEMMKQQIPNPDLAFLSACQTSKGDSKLSEEVVHLAAGMLSAGYRGVVGTMWSISDTYGPEFATEFYQYLIREEGSGGISSDKAAYALDHATRKVREQLGQDPKAFSTWIPYVHYGY